METATEAVLHGILKAVIQKGQNEAAAHAIVENLYAAADEMTNAAMPAEGMDVSRMADFARDCLLLK